jgi:5'-nucleotidase
MKYIIIHLFIYTIFVSIGCSQTGSVTILYSHNTNGVLENCNCPEHSYGALEKRAMVIDSIRNHHDNVLLLDTGDILDIVPNPLLHDYIVKAYDYMNYDYWTPGDQDFTEGTDFFLSRLSKWSGSLLSTNIYYNNSLIGQSYIIKKIGQFRIGITGTIKEDFKQYLDSETSSDFEFKDQFSGLAPVINEMSDKSDFIILLSHSGYERDRLIAQKIPSIDLIIGGHSQTIMNEPEKFGSTYITQVGESGYRLGVFEISFKEQIVTGIKSQVILLSRNKSDDPYVVELIKKYHEERLRE